MQSSTRRDTRRSGAPLVEALPLLPLPLALLLAGESVASCRQVPSECTVTPTKQCDISQERARRVHEKVLTNGLTKVTRPGINQHVRQ